MNFSENQPGLKAIKAALLMRAGSRQVEAMKLTGSTKPSIAKYKPLVEETIADLYRCFKGPGNQLVIAYSLEPAYS